MELYHICVGVEQSLDIIYLKLIPRFVVKIVVCLKTDGIFLLTSPVQPDAWVCMVSQNLRPKGVGHPIGFENAGF